MRTRLLLAASLLANAALLGGAAYLSKQDIEDLSTAPPIVVCVPELQPDRVGTPGADTAPPGKVIKTAAYVRVESEDYRRYVAELRSLGYPEERVLSLLTADVNDLFHWRAKGQLSSAKRVGP